jgi:hypothetical protein
MVGLFMNQQAQNVLAGRHDADNCQIYPYIVCIYPDADGPEHHNPGHKGFQHEPSAVRLAQRHDLRFGGL